MKAGIKRESTLESGSTKRENTLESEMGSLDMDLECRRSIEESKTLAGIFQSIVQDCKVFQASFSTSFHLRRTRILPETGCTVCLFLDVQSCIGKMQLTLLFRISLVPQ